jgi:phenylpropionate dioxygenase-like ring-hydroxylating dioxygenase large terminal subunit
MWLAVGESKALGSDPVRTTYWGTPVVLFRTAGGTVGALEDRCAHRAVPLSAGHVRGEALRCAFHHFSFSPEGVCVDAPPVFQLCDEERRGCTVPRFFVREAAGLIWISIEDEAAAPFPLDGVELPEDPSRIVTGSFEVGGDLRVWMDHFLDGAHCLWAHAESAYGGSHDAPAEMRALNIDITAESEYPVRSAVSMSFHLTGEPDPPSYSRTLRTVARFAKLRRALRVRRRRVPEGRHLEIEADLLTPLCQYTRSSYTGRRRHHGYEAVTAIHPVGPGKNRFFWAAFFRGEDPGRLDRYLQRKFLEGFVPRHLGVEDATLLAQTPFLPRDAIMRTRPDSTVLAMRVMFSRYLERKRHVFPPGSLIHSLDYC